MEVGSVEGVAAFEGHEVGTDVVHDVLVLGGLVLQHQQVVLAQYPGGHPAQHGPQLDGTHPGGDRRRPLVGVLGHPCDERAQQALQGGQVGPDPVGPTDDTGPGVTGQRPEARGGGDQVLGARRVAVKLGGQTVEVVGTTERSPVGYPDGDPLGQIPVDERFVHRVHPRPPDGTGGGLSASGSGLTRPSGSSRPRSPR